MKIKTFLFFILSLLSVSALAHASLESDLITFLQSSTEGRLQFLKLKKFHIFKSKSAGRGLDEDFNAFVSVLPEAEGQLHRRFTKDFSSGTLGLYLSPRNAHYEVKVPTLIISPEATNWTLIHELAHALLDETRNWSESDLLETYNNVQEDFQESMHSYQAHGEFRDSHHAQKTFESLKMWSLLEIKFLEVFELEEVKIERLLRSLYHQGFPLSFLGYSQSDWYMRRNCEQAKSKSQSAHILILDIHSKSLLPSGPMNSLLAEIEFKKDSIHRYCSESGE